MLRKDFGRKGRSLPDVARGVDGLRKDFGKISKVISTVILFVIIISEIRLMLANFCLGIKVKIVDKEISVAELIEMSKVFLSI